MSRPIKSLSRPTGRPARKNAFSLIELLTVVSICAVLSAIALPAMGALRGANGLNKAAYDLGSQIEQSRAYAMAYSTYVWVALGNSTNAADNSLGAVVFSVASRDGSSNSASSSNLYQIGKAINTGQVALSDTSDLPFASRRTTVTQFASLPVSDATAIEFPAKLAQYANMRLIRISPTGELLVQNAQANWQKFRWVEIGLRQTRGTQVVSGPNAAALQFAGLTGQYQVFRP